MICGLGVTSLVTDSDVIAVPGSGVLPGVVGVVATAAAYAVVVGVALRAPHPSFWSALWAALACFLAYVFGVWLAVVVQAGDLAVATAAAGGVATSWFGAVVAVAAAVAAWSAVALVRTHARRPRWPWEGDDPDAA